MVNESEATDLKKMLLGTSYPSWILMLITIAYAFFILIVLGIIP